MMTFQQEWASWKTPTANDTASAPAVASFAPSSSELQMPPADKKPTIITFLRHCGCPFAEKNFRQFAKLSCKHPEVSFIAVSHSSQAHTDKWIAEVGGEWNVKVIVDPDRKLYAAWGLGTSSAWHVLNPWSMYSVYRLASVDKISNRPTETGTRWQMSGSFAVDGEGLVRWSEPAKAADHMPDYKQGLEALGVIG